MWCTNCQQDVPAIASPDESIVRCAKCHTGLAGGTDESSVRHVANSPALRSAVATPVDGFAMLDDWELDDDLHEAQRLVESIGVGSSADNRMRIDPQHAALRSDDSGTAKNTSRTTRQKADSSSFFSWLMLALGLMAFVFGSVLLGWSFATERADLWRLGMPFTLGGQAALIVGLVFQLDGLWRSNRQASETMDELDSQLDELRHTTSLLSTTRNSPSQSFYLHMAEGASPKLLLADLKGQLDLLASRLAEER